jgi:hypothetical protein
MTSSDRTYKYNIGDKVVAVIDYPGNLSSGITADLDGEKTCIGNIVARNYLGPNEVYNISCNVNGKVYNHIDVKYIEEYGKKKASVEDRAMSFMKLKKGESTRYLDSLVSKFGSARNFGGKKKTKRRRRHRKSRKSRTNRK